LPAAKETPNVVNVPNNPSQKLSEQERSDELPLAAGAERSGKLASKRRGSK